MQTVNLQRANRGLALVLALVSLLVMTIASIGIMSNASLQERMAGNQKRIAESSMAAEAAINDHFQWLAEDPIGRWGSTAWPNDQANAQTYGYATEDGGTPLARFYTASWAAVDGTPCTTSDSRCFLRVVGEAMGGSVAQARTELEATFEYNINSMPLGGGADILCGGNAAINGGVHFTNTYLHCNGEVSEVDIKGQSDLYNSRITSNGSVELKLGDCDECSFAENADIDNPPPDFAKRVRDFLEEASINETVTFHQYDDDGNIVLPLPPPYNASYYDGGSTIDADCSSKSTIDIDLDSLASGSVVVVNGHARISGDGDGALENVTIISACDMTHNGSVQPTGGVDGGVSNVFYSGGDITFNGATGNDSTPFYGRFYGAGDITQNGNADIYGQIIMNGDIRQNGGLRFIGVSNLGGNTDTEIAIDFILRDWAQVWN